MLERDFQANLIKELRSLFPGCLVLKTDPNYIQGFPDLLILYKRRWAALECKRSRYSSKRANQDFYVHRLNKMSFARMIFPENKKEILDELQSAFKFRRPTRLLICEQVSLDKL